MTKQTIYIAGWRDGIRDPHNDLHWRIYVGDSQQLIPARRIRFRSQCAWLPLSTHSGKTPTTQGFHVWFEVNGRYTVEQDIGTVELADTPQAPFAFSVRTASLYTADDWNNWCLFTENVGDTTTVRSIVFSDHGRALPLLTKSQKTPDDRDLLAWLEAQGTIDVIDGDATVTLSD